ncbi:MAG: YbaN family protein [Cocleimonas sp.]|nr:YbaN family protein [Cocleimonas sp.]
MKPILHKNLLIVLGCFFVLFGIIGVVLPILPTTPFMILALALFANSSPRFHKMLLDNRWFGSALKQWEDSKTISSRSKYRALLLVLASFSISIMILRGNVILQIMLLIIAIVFLFFIWQLKEN